jgi:hypothetical protein
MFTRALGRGLLLVALASFFPIGCGGGSSTKDGSPADARTDAGPSDMGTAPMDAAAADAVAMDGEAVDLGTNADATPTDTGTVAADAGPGDALSTDTGTIAADGGPTDALPTDTGTVAADASNPDATMDASPMDAAPVDSGPPDSGPDAGMPDSGACPLETACSLGGQNGLCNAQAQCSACVVPTDDAHCTTAYGGASNPYLCLAGACTPGNCRTSADCSGRICGLVTANFCGACTSDAQCQADPTYGANFVCNTSAGTCVAATCPTPDVVCPYNGADFCCPNSAMGNNTCVTGTCCVDGDCPIVGQRCHGHICTTCQPVANGIYYVDPATGNDTAATGDVNCPFRTITRAIAFLGGGLTQDATVHVLNTAPVSTTSGEAFPITVLRHVHVVGDPQMSLVHPPAGTPGFNLSSPNSSLSLLDIDGQGVAQIAINVTGGSALSTSIDHVVVQNSIGDGISVHNAPGQTAGGILTIGPGVQAMNNGTAAARRSGLAVVDQGHAVINGLANASGADQIAFNGNTLHGIIVAGNGSITVTATAGTGGAGNVVANGNFISGLWVEQVPAATATAALNLVFGLVTFNNGTVTQPANGISIHGGSNIRIRRAYALNNRASGVNITFEQTATGINQNVSHIDLGTDPLVDPGRNVLQSTFGLSNNARAGLCVNLQASARAAVIAAGNVFSGGRDCSQVNPGRITTMALCDNGVDLGNTSPNVTVDTLNCTQ